MDVQQWLKTPTEDVEPENLRLAMQRLKIHEFPNRTEFNNALINLKQKYDEVTQYRVNIQTKNDEHEEKTSLEKTKQLFTDNAPIIRLTSEYESIPIDDKDLNITLAFYPCKHTKEMKIYELMLVEKGAHHNQALYTKWVSFFHEGGVISGRFNCEQCRKEKDTLRTKFSRYNDKPIGSATLKLRVLR
jgi:hypothetical protein